MQLKTVGALLALLLASGIGCGQQNTETAPTPSATQATAPEPQPAAEVPAKTTESPAEQESVAAGETVQESASASSADTANILLAEAVTPAKTNPASRWKEGVNYTLMKPAQPNTVGPDKVEVTEIFWYGCPHCYALEPYLQNWLQKKASYIQFNRIPVTWGPVHQLHARLYYTLLELKREDLHVAAFRESQVGDHLIGRDVADTERVQRAFAKRQGIDGDAFSKAYHSDEVAERVAKAVEFVIRYKIDNVPRIAINGKYLTDVTMAGGSPSQLLSLINDLAASEHKKE